MCRKIGGRSKHCILPGRSPVGLEIAEHTATVCLLELAPEITRVATTSGAQVVLREPLLHVVQVAAVRAPLAPGIQPSHRLLAAHQSQ